MDPISVLSKVVSLLPDVIMEMDVIELDHALSHEQLPGARGVAHFLFLVEQVEHVLHVDERLLDHSGNKGIRL